MENENIRLASPVTVNRTDAMKERFGSISALDKPATNEIANGELDEMLYAREAEIRTLDDLVQQRGTSIPALYNQVYKFIQNPSTVSVETFKRMVDTDDTIGSGVDFLTTCLAARLGSYTHKNTEISQWVNARLEEIDNGWVNAVKEILSATWAGFSVNEKVWANTENGFVIKKLISLPPATILFETERTGEITKDGILQYQRNYNPALYQSGASYLFGFSGFGLTTQGYGVRYRPDPYAKIGDLPFPVRSPNLYSYLSIRIPIKKCIHYSFDLQGKFGNHYGRSLLRRAYKHWVLKDAVMQMLATALDRKGTPLTLVYVDPNATFIDADKSQSNLSARDKDVGIKAQYAVQKAFANVHNDSTIILPGKKDQFVSTDFVNQTSNASDFIATLDFLNRSIMRALLIPSLVFTNGDGSGSFALGQEHAKTFDKILDGFLSGLQKVLIQQLVEDMIRLNFPESAWKKDGFGEFQRRELSIEERDKEMACVVQAIDKGAIDLNDLDDLNKVREIAGFKPRDKVIIQDDFFDDEEGETDGGTGNKGKPTGANGSGKNPKDEGATEG